MKPLIKWPGGKSREIIKFSKLIPDNISRYIEPFFGGGAVYFHLQAQQSLVNDIDNDLISFYLNVKERNSHFLNELKNIASDWNNLSTLSESLNTELTEITLQYRKNGTQKKELEQILNTKISRSDLGALHIQDDGLFEQFLITSISSKIHRIIKLEQKHDMKFDIPKIREHIETAVRSAYYTLLRDIETNKINTLARFYFIREFCYGSMFRYNKAGKFNIPYGGINYNYKSFENKVSNLVSEKVQRLLSKTEFYNNDFETFLKKVKPISNDFVFFDPPYDTDFKDYGNNSFTLDDHERLARMFSVLSSKNVMIINSNKNILSLYREQQDENPSIKIVDYEKTYTYNVRGRNKRETNHLLITNFDQINLA